jgi:hypothetical protein
LPKDDERHEAQNLTAEDLLRKLETGLPADLRRSGIAMADVDLTKIRIEGNRFESD